MGMTMSMARRIGLSCFGVPASGAAHAGRRSGPAHVCAASFEFPDAVSDHATTRGAPARAGAVHGIRVLLERVCTAEVPPACFTDVCRRVHGIRVLLECVCIAEVPPACFTDVRRRVHSIRVLQALPRNVLVY